MNSFQKIFFIFFMLALANSALSAAIFETTFAELGHPDFFVEAPLESGCIEVPFIPSVDQNFFVYGIASVHADFFPTASKKGTIEVFLNEEKIGSIKSADFSNGFGRYDIPQGKLLEENSLKICAAPSFETTKIKIFNDSKIGYYQMPDFEKMGAFELHSNEPAPKIFEQFTVTAVLKNFGSESTNVLLKYRKDELEKETPETELLKGQTQVRGTVPACQKREADTSCIEPGVVEFNYQLRPKLVGPISLLPSTVEFSNPFGETVLVESNRPTLWIVEPEIKIKPFIQVQKEQFTAGDKANLTLLIANEGHDPLYNLFVKVQPDGLNILSGSETETIEIIQPSETISRKLTLSTVEAGEFDIGCSIDYLDYNVVQSKCALVTLEFKQPGIDITIAAALVLAIISVGIYGYLHFKKGSY